MWFFCLVFFIWWGFFGLFNKLFRDFLIFFIEFFNLLSLDVLRFEWYGVFWIFFLEFFVFVKVIIFECMGLFGLCSILYEFLKVLNFIVNDIVWFSVFGCVNWMCFLIFWFFNLEIYCLMIKFFFIFIGIDGNVWFVKCLSVYLYLIIDFLWLWCLFLNL